MDSTEDQSFGVVPVIKKNNEWHVLLVEQISYKGEGARFWTFPKGHPEMNESPMETALRELQEETNIQNVRLIEKAAFPIFYSFTHEGKPIKKTVTYYLGVCADTATSINLPAEIAEITWCTFAEARQKLTHQNAQRVLSQAEEYISNHL